MHTPTVDFDFGGVEEEEEEEVARVSDTVQPPDPLWSACHWSPCRWGRKEMRKALKTMIWIWKSLR